MWVMEAIVKAVWLLPKQMKEWMITTVDCEKSYVQLVQEI